MLGPLFMARACGSGSGTRSYSLLCQHGMSQTSDFLWSNKIKKKFFFPFFEEELARDANFLILPSKDI